MSKEFMNLSEEYRMLYESNINQMLETVANDNRFNNSIRNLCNQALINNWDISKKVNILNIVTQ